MKSDKIMKHTHPAQKELRLHIQGISEVVANVATTLNDNIISGFE
jgi:hypothetical protein